MATQPQPDRIGRYRILRELGRGATAIVYLAESSTFPGPVALKHVSFADAARDEAKWNRRMLKLLRAEKAVSERLDHPNIIRIFDAVVEDKQAYVVMEYFAGQSLERFCTFDKLLPVHRVIGIIFKCCLALDHAYRQGIVHRDIKPANILVDDEDNVKITDFGLALNIGKRVEEDSTFIMGVGSPAYMSPEQIKSYPLNQKTDLYSLGVVLFHLLAGRLPFRAANAAQLVYKIINADVPSVSQLNPDVPPQMDKVIRRAMEKDLYSRYKNGAEFAKDLSAVRYRIVDDDYRPPDMKRFSVLRRMGFLTEFEDIEIWELLRLATWRRVGAHTTLCREGEDDGRFGLLIEGSVELSVDGRRLGQLQGGTVFGETAWLDTLQRRHRVSVVTLSQCIYLDISPSALSLATEGIQSRLRDELSALAMTRLADFARMAAAHCEQASEAGYSVSGGLDLRLVDD